MKIRMNVTIRHHKYDTMYAGQEYHIHQDDALPLIAKKLDHLTNWASLVDGGVSENKEEIAKQETDAKLARTAKRIAKLKMQAKLVETNEKSKTIKANKLARINKELAELQGGADVSDDGDAGDENDADGDEAK